MRMDRLKLFSYAHDYVQSLYIFILSLCDTEMKLFLRKEFWGNEK